VNKADIPVLVLGYLRFDGILRQLESCVEAGVKRVYVSIDGAKSESDKVKQDLGIEAIRRYAETSRIRLHLRKRKSNVGLAVAVIEGISWFFSKENFGIILEDDLIVSQSFFDFVLSARELDRNDAQIMLISGNSYRLSSNNQVSATHYPLIWGWATWALEWEDFMQSLKSPVPFRLRLPIRVSLFWLTAALQSRFGYVDSWAMSFAQYSFSRNKLCLLPPVNLVTNMGADSIASHSSGADAFVGFPIQMLPPSVNWKLPNKDQINEQDRHLERYIFSIRFRHNFSLFKLGAKRFSRPKKLRLLDRIHVAALNRDIEFTEWGS
jgi:hypothetical protein